MVHVKMVMKGENQATFDQLWHTDLSAKQAAARFEGGRLVFESEGERYEVRFSAPMELGEAPEHPL